MKLLLLAMFWFQQGPGPAPAPPPPPTQPVPYSHKVHAGDLKLPCKTCHTNPDPGEVMGLPAVSTCMGCHTAIKTDSPHIQKLAAFAKNQRPLPWVRVYQIPSFVYFSHKAHAEAGAKCETCHGPVKEREVIRLESNITMGGCMKCHEQHNASNDCSYCHMPK